MTPPGVRTLTLRLPVADMCPPRRRPHFPGSRRLTPSYPACLNEQQQRAFHLKRLDRLLNRMGSFGTKLVGSGEPTDRAEYERTWTGLLVWNNALSAGTGIVVHCDPGPETAAWRYTYGDGIVIAGVFDQLRVVQELTRVLLPDLPDLVG
jgi:hypothetical protein